MALPAAAIVSQLAYPTILGWAVVFSLFVFYGTMATYYLVRNFGYDQWLVDTSGFVLGLIQLVIVVAVCLRLFKLRPWAANLTRPDRAS